VAFKLRMGDDTILRLSLSGVFDKFDAETLSRDLYPFLEASTEKDPIKIIIFPQQIEKITSKGRKFLTELHKNKRMGNSVFISPSRSTRVLVRFIIQATNKENIAFFDDEKSAEKWIKVPNNPNKNNLLKVTND